MTARDYLADALREEVPGVTYETAEDRMTCSIQLRLSLKVHRSQVLSEEAMAHCGGDFLAATLRTMIDDLRREVIHAAGLQSVIDAEAAKVRAKCQDLIDTLDELISTEGDEADRMPAEIAGYLRGKVSGLEIARRAAERIINGEATQ
jgi:hypothetical protein